MLDSKILKEYEVIDWKSLLKDGHGEGTLIKAKDDFDSIRSMLDKLISYDSKDGFFSSNQIAEIGNILHQFDQFLEQHVNHYGGDVNQRDSVLTNINNQRHEIFRQTKDILYFIDYHDPKKQEFENKYNEILKRQQDGLKKIDKVLNQKQMINQNKETSKFGDIFGELAKENKESADWNFKYMLGSLALVGLIVFIFFNVKPTETDTFSLIMNVTLRLTLISLGIYLVTYFSRKSFAENHLYYVNKHRQNAINSHENIIKSVQTEEGGAVDWKTQNAVLIQVTKAMYDHVDTGYLKNKGLEKSNNLMENIIVRSAE